MFARACWVTEEGSRPTILFLVKHIWNISDLNDTSPKLASYICILYLFTALPPNASAFCLFRYLHPLIRPFDYYVQLTNINVNITRGILFYFIWNSRSCLFTSGQPRESNEKAVLLKYVVFTVLWKSEIPNGLVWWWPPGGRFFRFF